MHTAYQAALHAIEKTQPLSKPPSPLQAMKGVTTPILGENKDNKDSSQANPDTDKDK